MSSIQPNRPNSSRPATARSANTNPAVPPLPLYGKQPPQEPAVPAATAGGGGGKAGLSSSARGLTRAEERDLLTTVTIGGTVRGGGHLASSQATIRQQQPQPSPRPTGGPKGAELDYQPPSAGVAGAGRSLYVFDRAVDVCRFDTAGIVREPNAPVLSRPSTAGRSSTRRIDEPQARQLAATPVVTAAKALSTPQSRPASAKKAANAADTRDGGAATPHSYLFDTSSHYDMGATPRPQPPQGEEEQLIETLAKEAAKLQRAAAAHKSSSATLPAPSEAAAAEMLAGGIGSNSPMPSKEQRPDTAASSSGALPAPLNETLRAATAQSARLRLSPRKGPAVAPNDEADISEMRTISDVVAYFSHTSGTYTPVKFVYLEQVPQPLGKPFRPYDLVVVPQAKANPLEHFVVSANSVVHIKNGVPGEVQSISQYVHEATLFNVLSKIKVFAKYLVMKAFVQWKANIRFKLFCDVRRRLSRNFFCAKQTFAQPVAKFRKAISKLYVPRFSHIPTVREGLPVERFTAIMSAQKQEGSESFRTVIEDVEASLAVLVNEVIANADVPEFATTDALMQYAEFKELEEASQGGLRPHAVAVSMNQHKANIQRRLSEMRLHIDCQSRLVSFVRLIDYMVAETLFCKTMDSLRILATEVKRRDDERCLFFLISIVLNPNDQVGFVPSEEEVLRAASDAKDEMIACVSYFPRLALGKAFRVLFPGEIPKLQNISNILREDRRIVEVKRESAAQLQHDFHDGFESVKHLGKNRMWLEYVNVEWPLKEVAWGDRYTREQVGKDLLDSMTDALRNEEFDKEFDRIEDAFAAMRDMHTVRRGSLVITPSAGLDFLNAKLRDIQQDIRSRLMSAVRTRLERTVQTLNAKIKSIADRPANLSRYAGFTQHLHALVEEAPHLFAVCEEINQLFDLAEQNECDVSQESARRELLFGTSQNQSQALRQKYDEALMSAKEFISVTRRDMARKLATEVALELDSVVALVKMLNDPSLSQYTAELGDVMEMLAGITTNIATAETQLRTFMSWQLLFEVPVAETTELDHAKQLLKDKKELWQTIERYVLCRRKTFQTAIIEVDVGAFCKEVDELYAKVYNKIHPKHQNNASEQLLENLKDEKHLMPTILSLGNKDLKREHWNKILSHQSRNYDVSLSLESCRLLKLFEPHHREVIQEQSSIASGEATLLTSLDDIKAKWSEMEFKLKIFNEQKDEYILDDVADIILQMEEHTLLVQSCLASRYVSGVRGQIEEWERRLHLLGQVIEEWIIVQGAWMYMSFIFGSDDIMRQLPTEFVMFRGVDETIKDLISRVRNFKKCIIVITDAPVLDNLRDAHTTLDMIQKRLEEYLETKRVVFPRFYFLSNDELLSILSDVRNPKAVSPHLRKCFDSMRDVVFHGETGHEIVAMVSSEGEAVALRSIVQARGSIEHWLNSLQDNMISSLREYMLVTQDSLINAQSRQEWIFRVQQGDHKFEGLPAQCIQAIDMVQFTGEVESAIAATREDPHALTKYHTAFLDQIQESVKIVRMPLTPLQRSLIGTMLVIGVHSRDVITRLIEETVTSASDFAWASQLRYYLDRRHGKISVEHVNAKLQYSFEYLGSAKRLVITPLTDRAFLTCTQALSLNLGGAPQGPAGTGKTESVKDLGKALARQVVVFNCSDGINISMMSQMFAGLVQGGAWACFDEFNRIELEVLSVVAQQMLEITTAIANGLSHLVFDGHDMRLHHNFGVFITMNPGYSGRTELPDNLKALFRPVCMMIADYRLIAEIMLFSEGFGDAQTLSAKMVQLYKLSSEQLSKQDHYDFGMRAVKSILVVAGSLKRAEPDASEVMLLIRAMRDSNIPKFLKDDAALFNCIIQDLFPLLEVTEKNNQELERMVGTVLTDAKLQVVPSIVAKILQLQETMTVRHGVMLVGQTQTGKTTCYDTLCSALTAMAPDECVKRRPNPYIVVTHMHTINPKAISREEMYGYVNITTREWTDGVLSGISRNIVSLASQSTDRHWIICDGPVDAIWIENLNTVLDDNKMLCLVNGERLKLPGTVTFCFEVQDLKVASPATVSRCGMVYTELASLAGGWQPLFASMTAALEALHGTAWKREVMRDILEKLVTPAMRDTELLFSEGCEHVPSVPAQRIRTMLALLSSLLATREKNDDDPPPAALPPTALDDDGQELPCDAQVVEVERGVNRNLPYAGDAPDADARLFRSFAIFAFIYGVGGNLSEKNGGREKFSALTCERIAALDQNFPKLTAEDGARHTVFDFSVHKQSLSWVRWAHRVPSFIYRRRAAFFDLLVPTVESASVGFVAAALVRSGQHVLISGLTGTGKSVGVQSLLFDVFSTEDDASAYQGFAISLSAQTTSKNIQEKIESRLRKHPSRRRDQQLLGPATNKKALLLFIDDINMPAVDEFGACPSLELLRQLLSQGGFFDRKKWIFKAVQDVTLIGACGPPGGGKHEITPRLSSRFSLLSQPKLSERSVQKVFSTILGGFFSAFDSSLLDLPRLIPNATVAVFDLVTHHLLPTPDKAHYTFNLRDVARVVQGICQVAPTPLFKDTPSFVRLWAHEATRVFHDRLNSPQDIAWWRNAVKTVSDSVFGPQHGQAAQEGTTSLFGDFGTLSERPLYMPLDYVGDQLFSILDDSMRAYFLQYNRQLDLVMFPDAVAHLARLCRVLRQPRGNALLVGMSGTGRQSIAQLAALLSRSRKFQINANAAYSVADFRTDLKKILLSAGCENQSTTFILASTQLVHEQFLEDVNNILNTGEVANLWEPEDVEKIVLGVRDLVRKARKPETLNSFMSFFTNKCRDNLHLVLTMSHVGADFKQRLRMFPSLVNCMTIDWYFNWPAEALRAVANRTLGSSGGKLADATTLTRIADMCVYMHVTAESACGRFTAEQRRPAYATPATYLALLSSFLALLKEKSESLLGNTMRFRGGLAKLDETNARVAEMRIALAEMQPLLEEQSAKTQVFADEVEKESVAAAEVAASVAIEEQQCSGIMQEAQAMRNDCQSELDKAMPAYNEALDALNSLNQKDINEAKMYIAPPKKVELVMDAVLTVLDEPGGWDNAKRVMGRADFVQSLKSLKAEQVPEKALRKLKKFIDMEDFKPDAIRAVSKACVSFCLWCRAIDNYCDVLKVVEPKRQRLTVAEDKLSKATQALEKKRSELRVVQAKVAALKADYDASIVKLKGLEDEKVKTELFLGRAAKLLTGLSSERVRWEAAIDALGKRTKTIDSFALLASGMIAYGGIFTAPYRERVVGMWETKIDELGFERASGSFVLQDAIDPILIRSWGTKGLPLDNFSTENGTIVCKSARWCLCIDPQNQINAWIRNTYKDRGLAVVTPNTPNLLRLLESAVRAGTPVLMEHVGEKIDAALDPLLHRHVFRQGGRLLMTLRDQPVEYDPNFFFIMTTQLSNPHFMPEVQVKVAVINSSVTRQGLEDQLLSEVVRFEKKELEERADSLIVQVAESQGQLKDIEDKILQMLSTSTIQGMLESDTLIHTLAKSKDTSAQIQVQLDFAVRTSAEIKAAREAYRPVAARGALVHSVLKEVAQLEHVYQTALSSFMRMFQRMLANTPAQENDALRREALIAATTLDGYTTFCRSIFNKDKASFAFLLAVAVAQAKGHIQPTEWTFFLRGSGGAYIPDAKDLPDEWLTENVWEDLQFLSLNVPGFAGLADSIVENDGNEWRLSFGDFNGAPRPKFMAKLSLWQQMLVARSFREDAVAGMAVDFVRQAIGDDFCVTPTFDLGASFANGTSRTPLILLLTPGTDPTKIFTEFATKVGFEASRRMMLSLGQGQAARAEHFITKARNVGNWVYLQNCHVYTSWLPKLEEIIENLVTAEQVHPEFRLWLTTMPTPEFPVSILQCSVKVSNEAPSGIKANAVDLVQNALKAKDWATASPTVRRLTFSLLMAHAVVQERKRFGALGWAVPYDWNNGDFSASAQTLQRLLDGSSSGAPPAAAAAAAPASLAEAQWRAVHYMIGVINYGGRVTDQWDLRCLSVVAQHFVSRASLDDANGGRSFLAGSEHFAMPPAAALATLDDLTAYMAPWPAVDQSPELMGLHSNANIRYEAKQSRELLGSVIGVQPNVSGGGGTASSAAGLQSTVIELLARLPDAIDTDMARSDTYELTDRGVMSSLGNVAWQEIARFNALLAFLRTSLRDVQLALKGSISMTAAIEDAIRAVQFLQVPRQWERYAYPSMKPLLSWIADLASRTDFFRDWNDSGTPSSFWLGAFFFPQGFITAVLQTHSRQHVVPIDELVLEAHPTTAIDVLESNLDYLTTGVYIYGLRLEGARWSVDGQCIAEFAGREVSRAMPIIALIPTRVQASTAALPTAPPLPPLPDTTLRPSLSETMAETSFRGDNTVKRKPPPPASLFECPVFKISTRCGTLSTTGISTNFILSLRLDPGQQAAEHWIRRGCALIATTDE